MDDKENAELELEVKHQSSVLSFKADRQCDFKSDQIQDENQEEDERFKYHHHHHHHHTPSNRRLIRNKLPTKLDLNIINHHHHHHHSNSVLFSSSSSSSSLKSIESTKPITSISPSTDHQSSFTMDISLNSSKINQNGPNHNEPNRRRSMSNVNQPPPNQLDPRSYPSQSSSSSSAQLHSHFNHQHNNHHYRQTRHNSISNTSLHPSSTTTTTNITHHLTTSNLNQARIRTKHRSPSISSNTSTNSSTSTLPTTINQYNRKMSPFGEKGGLPSPCFVHSHLDTNLPLPTHQARSPHRRDFRISKPISSSSNTTSSTVPSIKRHEPIPPDHSLPSPSTHSLLSPNTPRAPNCVEVRNHVANQGHDEDDDEDEDDDDDDDEGELTEGEEHESLTRQLAQTATSVREMSKTLARARIKGHVQSILIITKARDNHLIKLTRDLAIWLMDSKPFTSLSPNHPEPNQLERKPLVVYVDSQLKRSKRFDLNSINAQYPQFFNPLKSRHPFRRRFSRANSVSSNSTTSSSEDVNLTAEEDGGQLRYWTAEMCNKSPELFDFVITLGGDGTVLFASWLFQKVVPPIIPFALGSLGFLTNFDYSHYPTVLTQAMRHGVRVNLRMRFKCTVYRANDQNRRAIKSGRTGQIMMEKIGRDGWEALENGDERMERCQRGISDPMNVVNEPDGNQKEKEKEQKKKDKPIMCFSTRPEESFEVLNELVVDRGPSPYVSLLELFGDDHHMTTVQADGLTVSTPTGSTAYSLSAGGSLVHPEVPALLITPICPHTLSFRPMLLPESIDLRICVPYSSRSTAWASFDGRGRIELRQGDHIKVTASAYPFPTVCADNQSTDWFHAISRTLKWNERERQKSFVVVEEDGGEKGEKGKTNKGKKAQESDNGSKKVVIADKEEEEDEEDEDEEEEEEEEYDIDDLNPEIENSCKITSNNSSTTTSPQPNQSHHPRSSSSAKAEFMLQSGSSQGLKEAIQNQQGLIRRLSDVKMNERKLSQKRSSASKSKSNSNSNSSNSINPSGGSSSVKTFAVWGHDQSSDASMSDDE